MKMVEVNGEMRQNSTQEENPGKNLVGKRLYLALTLLLGWCGAHKFYARHYLKGLLYLLFCWTGIPFLISWIEFIRGCGEIRDENGRIWM